MINEINTNPSKAFLKGKQIEKVFMDILTRENYVFEESTREEDITLHVDVWAIIKSGKRVGIDVKGIKFGNEDRIVVELKNSLGNNGWLFGKQDLIAFETEDFFVLVQRDKLCILTSKLMVDKTFLVESYNNMPLYEKLLFNQNKSELVRLKLIDIMPISNKIFRKKIL